MRWNIPDTQRQKGKIKAACMYPPDTPKDSNTTYYVMITVTARLFFNLSNGLLAPQGQGLCIILKKIFLIYLFLAVLGLLCCKQAFSSCGEWGLLSSCPAPASHCCGFSYCGAQALATWASVLVVHGLSCPMACGIFLDQGLNLCPLYWQVDS